MNYFIDLGASDCGVIDEFYNWKQLFNNEPFKIYGFEPNLEYKKNWDYMMSIHKEIDIIPKAAWTDNETRDFYLGDDRDGSSLMVEKQVPGKKITAECIDFSAWLRNTVDENDYVIVKMDIEGAEMPLLTKMIQEGTDKLMDVLLVEFHDYKMAEYPSNKKWMLETIHCEVHTWR